jgi:thiamine-phosphate pyrophosphorylase
MRGFYFITDSGLSRAGNKRDLRSALAAGVEVVQYRDKQAGTRQMYEEALQLRKLCKGAIFLINDRVDIALGVGADGVHLGSRDLPYQLARKLLGEKRIIGLTVHSLKEAREAQELGADYLGVSPVFSTGTKPDAGEPLGCGLIRKIKEDIRIPLVAIGGISLKNAREVIRSGADSLCAISAVVTKADVRKEIEKFQDLF